MTDKKDTPIIEQEYLSGLKVIDIGDIRVARGLARRPYSGCPHRRLVYDNHERRIWCKDCERDVEAFDAFVGLVEPYSRAISDLEHKREKIAEAEGFSVRSLAAKEIDKAWRHKNMIPSCPHCGNGLFPEHFKNGCGMIGKDYAAKKLERKATS
jgi:hypothetical protein